MAAETESESTRAMLVLAAGESRRFGLPKQLAILDGKSLIRRAAEAALELNAGPVFVVLGANSHLVRPHIEDLPLTIVINDDWREGIGLSLKRGLRSVLKAQPATSALLVALADQPLVGSDALRRLLAAFDETGAAIAAARYNNTLGVPAVFRRQHFDSIVALDDSKGASGIIRSAAHVVTVEMPEAGTDIDTPADLEALYN